LRDWNTGEPEAHTVHVKSKFTTCLYPPEKESPLSLSLLAGTEMRSPTAVYTAGVGTPPKVMVTLAVRADPRKLPGLPTATHTTLPAATATVVVAHLEKGAEGTTPGAAASPLTPTLPV